MKIDIGMDWQRLMGQLITYERERADLTQIKAAKIMGMAPTTYREKEYGQGLNPIFLIQFSCFVLNKSPNYMFDLFLKVVHEKGFDKELFRKPDSPP